MPWGIAGAVIGAGISYLGASEQASATESAANTQAASSAASIAEQRRQYDQTREDYKPYREAGYRALSTFEPEINRMPTAEEVMSQPGYQFGLTQGQRALDRKFAASGGRVSGAALKSAAEYATNYATTGYNAEYQRRQDRLNRLAALAQIGQSATGSSAAAGAGAANAISAALQSQGDASAAAQLQRGNIWANATNQFGAQAQRLAARYGNGFGNYGDGFSMSGISAPSHAQNLGYAPDAFYGE